MIHELRDGKRYFRFDTERSRLECEGFSAGLGEFLRGSEGAPWNAEPERVLRVESAMKEGTLLVRGFSERAELCLEFRFQQEILHCAATFRALRPLKKYFAAVALPIPDAAKVTMPMSLYNDNPAVSPQRTAPHFPKSGIASLMLEEAQFPIPGVNAESDGRYLSLFLRPEGGWSLGAERKEAGDTAILLGSGCVSFNGEHDCAYELKNDTVTEERGYRDLAAGDSLTVNFFLHWGTPEREGEGFRDLAATGYELFHPTPEPVLTLDEMISLKMTALRERWSENGYLCVMPDNLYLRPSYFLYGWTGQSIRLALCDVRHGFLHGEAEGIGRGLRAAEFFIEHSATGVPGLRNTAFFLEKEKWCGGADDTLQVVSSRALGETWSDLARLLIFCKEHQISVPETFLPALRNGLEFMLSHLLPQGVPPMMWNQKGEAVSPEVTAAGTSFLIALFFMARLTGESSWSIRAEEMLSRYWKLGGDRFDTPFSRATLDAGCEDKEAGIPFFIAAAEAWKCTGNPEYLHWAEATADWLLTWVYFWNVPLREGSVCARHGFKSVGWPTVSVENQHLDVFFPAWELFRFGLDTGNERFLRAGELVFKAWSHGISKGGGDWLFSNPGRQAEQFFQSGWVFRLGTRFDRFPEPFRYRLKQYGYSAETIDRLNPRGGCNPWDVSWIIALVLDAALSFEEFRQKERK